MMMGKPLFAAAVLVTLAGAFVLPQSCRREMSLRARREGKDGRMEKFYKEKFSSSAASEYRFRQERDRKKYSSKRAKQLGSKDGEEYDLYAALDANTDDSILKIIAGAFIGAVLLAFYFGVAAPLLQPASFTSESGVRYIQDPRTGVFVEADT